MTERLYDHDSHLCACKATVRACTPVDGGFDVLLDRTVLFPTGGGQQTDLGKVGTANVLACRDEGAEVVHRVDTALAAGSLVEVTLDWARRFDFMQQHTGEHLLSFAAYKLFGAANVGFHLAETYTTIDFDKPLSPAQLSEMEQLANSFVWRNLPVTATCYPDEAAIADLPLRKHAEGLTAPIRIVQIQDADCCTCCAPHCAHTGEVGVIFLLDASAYKGGTRLTFLCGKRALAALRGEHDALDRIARRFSTSRELAESAVYRRCDEYGALKRTERLLTAELNGYVAQELTAGAQSVGKHTLIVRLFDGMDAARLKDLAQTVAKNDTLAVLFSRADGKLLYVLACGEGFPLDAGELAQAVNAAVGGKGGGRGTLAQGMAQSVSGAAESAEQVRHYLSQRLK